LVWRGAHDLSRPSFTTLTNNKEGNMTLTLNKREAFVVEVALRFLLSADHKLVANDATGECAQRIRDTEALIVRLGG